MSSSFSRFFSKMQKKFRIAGAMRGKTLKASHEGLRPQARVGAQPPKAALSAETEAAARRRLMRGGAVSITRQRDTARTLPLIRPRAGPRPPSPSGEAFRAFFRIAPAMRDFFVFFEIFRGKLLDIGNTVGYNNIAFSRAHRQMWRYSSVG